MLRTSIGRHFHKSQSPNLTIRQFSQNFNQLTCQIKSQKTNNHIRACQSARHFTSLVPRICDTSLTQNFNSNQHLFPHQKNNQTCQNTCFRYYSSSTNNRRVLLLGSGLVTGPIVEYLSRHSFIQLTIAGVDSKSAQQLYQTYYKDDKSLDSRVISLDVTNEPERLNELISQHDLVLSLVPAPMHPPIAKLCINHGKSLITASYISPHMQELHNEAVEKGVMLLNEIGLDPGIDHMMVMQLMDQVREKQGNLKSFQSYCGALPSPENSDNPLGYKFSWSPQGVITASQNPAMYMEHGKQINVDGESLLFSSTPLDTKATFAPGFAFEMVPNRDSLRYIDFYGFDRNHIETMIRGTLRFPGFCNMFRVFRVLGLFNSSKTIEFDSTHMSWKQVITQIIGQDQKFQSNQEFIEFMSTHITKKLKEKYNQLGISRTDDQLKIDSRRAVNGMIRLGMFDENPTIQKQEGLTPMRLISNLLSEKLIYQPKERDLIFMHHEFIVEYGSERERVLSTLCAYGDEKFSATAKTVGLPLAMSAVLYLRGELSHVNGVLGPTKKEIYNPILEMLEKEGIHIKEEKETLFLDEHV